MTAKEFIHRLPLLTNNTLPAKPPIIFNNLSARVFPLRANLDTLQQVVSGYLNIVPQEAGYFRVAMPYCYLMMLDYGQISQAVARTGWFAQVEVFFSIPVEWYKLVDGRLVFHDWAIVTPYIFVDDMLSVPLGRTVYGFPKVLASVMATKAAWVTDPTAPVTLARLETMVFPEAYRGTRLETRVFLEVERKAPMSNFRVPFDPASPIAPWTMASNLADALGGFGRDAMWLAQAMRIFPVNPIGNPSLIQEIFARALPVFAPGGSGFIQNSVNLKQFRRADAPDYICFQALTNGEMRATAFNAGGLLGEDRSLLGDLSGGYTVRLYEHSSLPIARTLGLEINRCWRGDNVDVAELRPVIPFWIDVNLLYDKGTNLAWRTIDGIWKDDTGKPFDPAQKPAKTIEAGPEFNSVVTSSIEAIAGPFQFSDTTIRVLPLLARKSNLQRFLDGYLNEPLQSPILRVDGRGEEHVRLSIWTRTATPVDSGPPIWGDFAYLYLTASSFGGVTSKTDNVGDWADYALDFLIPVKFERWNPNEPWDPKGDHWETAGVGLVPAFSMVDGCVAAISRVEIQGLDTSTATFVRPESVWLSEGMDFSPDPEQTLLRVDTEVWIAAGQQSTLQPVVEISRGVPDAGLAHDSRDTPYMRAEDLRLELGAKKSLKARWPEQLKTARALALELLGNQTPFSLYTLKQFRDVADPDKACYQSLVRVPRVLKELFDVREIEDTLLVRIRDYPSINIVETLGIVAQTLGDKHNDDKRGMGIAYTPPAGPAAQPSPDQSDKGGTGIAYTALAIRPFFIHATVDEPLAECLAWRAQTSTWSISPNAFQTILSDEDGSPRITADKQAETLQDQMDPRPMTAIMYQARQRLKDPNPDPDIVISKAEARQTFNLVDPQTVIESVLSREWGNNDKNARWRQGRGILLNLVQMLPHGGSTQVVAESSLFRQQNNLMAERPGAVAAILSVQDNQPEQKTEPPTGEAKNQENRWQNTMKKILGSQEKFTELLVAAEASINVLSAFSILDLNEFRAVNGDTGAMSATVRRIYEAAKNLHDNMTAIIRLKIQGEPSEKNNLDTQVIANRLRLKELLDILDESLQKSDSSEEILEAARNRKEEWRQAIGLAREYCTAQQTALVNKLSRAYQRPDFCIRRDSVGPKQNDLLPLSLSWDESWYYGENISLDPPRPQPPGEQVTPTVSQTLLQRTRGQTVKQTRARGGKRQSPAKSPRVAGE
jgi:hypothetical protein